MKKRNVIIAAILAVVVAGGSIGGYYGFRSANRPVTMVYAVNELSGGYWGDNMTLDGMITSDASQNVYLSSGQKVKEVLVSEGDTVSEGDVIMTYDTTAKELDLETMELEQKQNALKLEQAQKQLKQLKQTKPVTEDSLNPSLDPPDIQDPFFPELPGAGMEDPGEGPEEDPGTEVPEPSVTPEPVPTESPEPSVTPEPVPTESPEPSVTPEPSPTATPEPTPTVSPSPDPGYEDAILYDGDKNPLTEEAEPYKGTGKKEDPAVFLCSPGTVLTGGFFNRMAGFDEGAKGEEDKERKSYWFRLEIREGNKAAGALQTVWEQDGALIQEPYEKDYRTVFQIGSRETKEPVIVFEEPFSSAEVREGEPVRLGFSVREEKDTVYHYQWFRKKAQTSGDKEKTDGGWTEMPEQKDKTELVLEAAGPEDLGMYMVQMTAENAYGASMAVATANLTAAEEKEEQPAPTPSTVPTQAPDAAPEPTAEPTSAPEPTEMPGTTAEPTSAPEPTETPEATAEPASAPEPTETPEAMTEPASASEPKETPAPHSKNGQDESAPRPSEPAAVQSRLPEVSEMAAIGGSVSFQSSSGDTISVTDGKKQEKEEDSAGREVNLGALQESYTKEELKQAISDKEKEIRDLNLNQREVELKIRNARRELENQTVKASVSGVVKKVGDPEKPSQDGSAFIQIDSEQGLYVKGYVSELLLDQMVPGTQLQVNSWMSGAFATATVKEVSPYPTEEYSSYGSGAQASYYPFIALLDEGTEGFENMESVSMSMTVGADEASQNGIYLNKMFIREENGQKYVYVRGKEGILERRPVVTGKIVWGSEYEIKSGLTAEDYIAFPYAKNELEGTRTEESTLSELYNY